MMVSSTIIRARHPQPSYERLSKLALQGPKRPRLEDRPIRNHTSIQQAALRLAETGQAQVLEIECATRSPKNEEN